MDTYDEIFAAMRNLLEEAYRDGMLDKDVYEAWKRVNEANTLYQNLSNYSQVSEALLKKALRRWERRVIELCLKAHR